MSISIKYNIYLIYHIVQNTHRSYEQNTYCWEMFDILIHIMNEEFIWTTWDRSGCVQQNVYYTKILSFFERNIRNLYNILSSVSIIFFIVRLPNGILEHFFSSLASSVYYLHLDFCFVVFCFVLFSAAICMPSLYEFTMKRPRKQYIYYTCFMIRL